MWMFTTRGFLSIVQHNAMPDHFQVKSRVPGPLESLWPDHEVEVIASVDYTSFKDACSHDSKYHTALTRIWNIMYSYQMELESLI